MNLLKASDDSKNDFYDEILQYENEFMFSSMNKDDPMKDPYFMAFLSSLSTQEKKTKKTLTRIGQCEHPKHILYRQEKYTFISSKKEANMMKSVPRRGRPPKGSKTSEPVVKLTVRPLPKRLEGVVGRANIKVCLTCLKRSDIDPEYLQHEAYIGPQQIHHKKK